jgi:hypothetical protein
LIVFEKLSYACFFQIALKTILLPILTRTCEKTSIYCFKKNTDFAILPTKNQICAIKEVLFRIAYQTNLVSVLAWGIREMRLHQVDGSGNDRTLHFNLKLDGRPFWGRYNSDGLYIRHAYPHI